MSADIWFRARGDYGSSIISTNARSLVYRGKATFVRSESWFQGNGYYIEMIQKYVGTPLCINYIFTYTANDGEQIRPAIYYNGYAAITYCKRVSGNTWTIEVFAQGMPEIHIFSPITIAATSGYTINVFDALGRPAFSASQNHMLVRHITNISSDGSNIQRQRLGSFNASYPSTSTFSAAIPSSIRKPLILQSAAEHALDEVQLSSIGGYASFYARAYYAVNGTVYCRWVFSWVASGYAENNTFNAPGQDHSIVVLDAEDYVK